MKGKVNYSFRVSGSIDEKIKSLSSRFSLTKSQFLRALVGYFFLYYDSNSHFRDGFNSYIKRLKDEGVF